MAGWISVPWLNVFGMALPLFLRGLFGTLLLTLWLAPLVMIVMAASAWLKRWGVPAVAIAVGVSGLVLDKVYGNTVVWNLLKAQLAGSNQSFLADPKLLQEFGDRLARDPAADPGTWAWALQDAWAAVQSLASPHLIVGLLVAVPASR